jgi:hypothetical protein
MSEWKSGRAEERRRARARRSSARPLMRSFARPAGGQSSTETLLLLPLFLIMAFGLIQIGLLGTALVTTTYAAGSIARKAVAKNDYAFNVGNYQERFKNLLFGGMQVQGLSGHAVSEQSGFYNLSVNACAKVNALPMMGYFLKGALGNTLAATDDCKDESPPVSFFNQPPYYFVVHGAAQARMNYRS